MVTASEDLQDFFRFLFDCSAVNRDSAKIETKIIYWSLKSLGTVLITNSFFADSYEVKSEWGSESGVLQFYECLVNAS